MSGWRLASFCLCESSSFRTPEAPRGGEWGDASHHYSGICPTASTLIATRYPTCFRRGLGVEGSGGEKSCVPFFLRTCSFHGFLGILRCMAVSVRQLVRLLEGDGWVEVRQRGSHRQFRHPTKSGTVTVAGKESADVPPGTLNSVLKQAGLKNQR